MPLRRHSFILLAMTSALCIAAERPSVPAWLTAYPGAAAQTKTSPEKIEISYQAPASVADVVAHYEGLFTAAGLPFRPQMYGSTAVIQGGPADCSLTIQIRKLGSGAAVQITAIPHAVVPHLTEDDIVRSMAEFDKPVYPGPRTPMPALAWPSWLTASDTVPLEVYKGVDQFKLDYLKAAFTSSLDRAEVQHFYVDLFNSHDYPVSVQSSSITPPNQKAIVEGTHAFARPGPRFVIHAEFTPVNGQVHVDLRITAHH
jgi:hypothetical protein